MCRYAEEDGLSPHLIFFTSLLLPLAYLQQHHFKFCDGGSGGGDDDVDDDDYLSVLLIYFSFSPEVFTFNFMHSFNICWSANDYR